MAFPAAASARAFIAQLDAAQKEYALTPRTRTFGSWLLDSLDPVAMTEGTARTERPTQTMPELPASVLQGLHAL